jgi:hypothetical protein
VTSDPNNILLELVPLPDSHPVEVRVRQLVKYAGRAGSSRR